MIENDTRYRRHGTLEHMSASPGASREPILEFDDVSFGYAPGRPVLRDVNLVVDRGEFVAVAGPNGGGKTTLLRLALGLETPSTGAVTLFGDPAQRCRRRSEIGYVAQRTLLGGEAPATVRELVAAGRLASGGLLGPLRRVDRGLVDQAVARVGLAERARAPLRTLSGGMQQRAFIAKALAA